MSLCHYHLLPIPRSHICSQWLLLFVPQGQQSSHHHPTSHRPPSYISGLCLKYLCRCLTHHHRLGSSTCHYHHLWLALPMPMILQMPMMLAPHCVARPTLRILLEHLMQLTTHLGTHVTLDTRHSLFVIVNHSQTCKRPHVELLMRSGSGKRPPSLIPWKNWQKNSDRR